MGDDLESGLPAVVVDASPASVISDREQEALEFWWQVNAAEDPADEHRQAAAAATIALDADKCWWRLASANVLTLRPREEEALDAPSLRRLELAA